MKKRQIKKIPIVLVLFAVLVFGIVNVLALVNYGEGDYVMSFHLDDYGGFAVSSVTINSEVWDANEDYRFHTSDNRYEIVILAGKNGDNYPWISTAGGLDDYKTYIAVENPDEDPNVENDELKLTLILNGVPYTGDLYDFGITLSDGPFPVYPQIDASADISITISGDELEYHYDAEHLDEADVAYFKFDINGGTEEDHLVPFTFRNAEYTYNDNPAPNNVSSVRTKEPIHYNYQYDGSGNVNFCVNGGGTDEYTNITINGVDYSDRAPHSKVKHFESMMGWAQMFCFEIPYNENEYIVSVTGEQTSVENRIPGFGWSYLSSDRSDISDEEEGNFAHGRLEFVSATYKVDNSETITINNAQDFNNYRYHGTGQIFQWIDGNKNYQEENRREAWGEAQLPYGTTLTVRIVPDEGYQLTALATSPNGFQATETPGVYRITLDNNNFSFNDAANRFDLNPTFTRVDDVVKADSVNVRSGNIETNQAVSNGTLKLQVNDTASMSQERRESFENLATAEGYEIENYLDISLYNSIYKGGKKDSNNNYLSWDTEINNLTESARITLELEQNMQGKELSLIHEKYDGENYTYEVVPSNFDSQTNTLQFETNSFSDYAVALRDTNPENPPVDMVRVEFNTRGGSEIEPVDIEKGSTVQRPEDPTNGDQVFGGWFEDEDCTRPFDFNLPINENTTIFAKWEEPVVDTIPYQISDGDNIIEFKDEEGHEFHLHINNYLSMSNEELEDAGVPVELFNQVLESLTESTKKHGKMLGVYEIVVEDENHTEISEPLIGKITLKIKMTDEMKGFNTFKLIYVEDDFSLGQVITLSKKTIDGVDYLVGTLDHLSTYVLTGSKTSNNNPYTADNILIYVLLFITSVVGFIIGIKKTKKIN